MKFSDAVVLGSCVVTMEAGVIERCAIGAACFAISVEPTSDNATMYWPWLNGPRSYPRLLEITDMFDNRVCTGAITMDEFLDHIKSIEPECGECNDFNCCCERISHFEKKVYALLASAGRKVGLISPR